MVLTPEKSREYSELLSLAIPAIKRGVATADEINQLRYDLTISPDGLTKTSEETVKALKEVADELKR